MVEASEIFNVRKNSPNTDFEASAHDLLSVSKDQILNFLKSNIISPYCGVVRSTTVTSTFESRKSIQIVIYHHLFSKDYHNFSLENVMTILRGSRGPPSLHDIRLYSTNAHSNISFILCYCLHAQSGPSSPLQFLKILSIVSLIVYSS